MSVTVHDRLAALLIDLESELRNQSLWSAVAPSPAALASTAPFACDCLTFAQWLQYLFIPRLHELIESGDPLPAHSGVAPMAEEYFRHHPADGEDIIDLLGRIDRLISD